MSSFFINVILLLLVHASLTLQSVLEVTFIFIYDTLILSILYYITKSSDAATIVLTNIWAIQAPGDHAQQEQQVSDKVPMIPTTCKNIPAHSSWYHQFTAGLEKVGLKICFKVFIGFQVV